MTRTFGFGGIWVSGDVALRQTDVPQGEFSELIIIGADGLRFSCTHFTHILLTEYVLCSCAEKSTP